MERDPEQMAELMREAQKAEAEERRERISNGDIPEGQDCPYCGEPVTEDRLHLECF